MRFGSSTIVSLSLFVVSKSFQLHSCSSIRVHCFQRRRSWLLKSASHTDHMNPPNTDTLQSQPTENILFGRFRISQSQIFHRSSSGLTFAMVNLRPIVEGHVLVVPFRIVPKLKDLTDEEYADLWFTVRMVQRMLEKHYFSNYTDNPRLFGFNVAVQDGVSAGQSVEHVHVHILPRKKGDLARNDDIYDEMQDWAPTEQLRQFKQSHGLGRESLHVPADEQRRDRTLQEMENEANLYRDSFLR
jgi:bis(5'-adenosyl)-triphosphatase